MLKADCRLFRLQFEPGSELAASLRAHRRGCAGCDAYATRLEELKTLYRPQKMPMSLRRQLRRVAIEEVSCGAVDRLYAATLPDARDDSAVTRHLAACRRCARVYGVLNGAWTARRAAPMPRQLRNRLRAVASRQPVGWFLDVRLTAAASYVLTALLMLTLNVDDATARLRDSSLRVGSQMSSWVEVGERQGRELWQRAAADLDQTWTSTSQRAERTLDFYKSLWVKALATLQPAIDATETLDRHLFGPSGQGEEENASDTAK